MLVAGEGLDLEGKAVLFGALGGEGGLELLALAGEGVAVLEGLGQAAAELAGLLGLGLEIAGQPLGPLGEVRFFAGHLREALLHAPQALLQLPDLLLLLCGTHLRVLREERGHEGQVEARVPVHDLLGRDELEAPDPFRKLGIPHRPPPATTEEERRKEERMVECPIRTPHARPIDRARSAGSGRRCGAPGRPLRRA